VQPGADGQLVARMAAALAGIGAQVWPPAVLVAPADALLVPQAKAATAWRSADEKSP
jgi:hypothetical protein